MLSYADRAPSATKVNVGRNEVSPSAWSRETTAETSAGGDAVSRWPFARAASLGDLHVLRESRIELQELLRLAVCGSAFAVTLAEPCTPGAMDMIRIIVASMGFEEMCEWPETALLGGSARALEAPAEEISIMDEAKLQLSHEQGTPCSCLRTMRKASGDMLLVWEHLRGLSFGRDLETGEEVWYLLAVYIELGEDEADGIFAEDVAQAIAERIRSDVARLVARLEKPWGFCPGAPAWKKDGAGAQLVAEQWRA